MDQHVFEAIGQQNHDLLQRTLSSVNVNEVGPEGFTPLFYACMRKGVGITTVEEILRLGAEVDLKGSDRETPLYISCFNGKTDVVLLLLHRGADANATNGIDNETALHVAARTGNCALIDILLSRKANINAQNIRKETPLYSAAKAGFHDAVYCLINAGANINICDMDGKSPLYVASVKNLKHVVIILKSDPKELTVAKAMADAELRSRPQPIRSTEAICEEAAAYAAAGRFIPQSSLVPEVVKETKPLEVVEIVVPRPKAGSRNPFAAVSGGPCWSLEEVGYDEPPPIPPGLQNRSPVKPQRIGGTLMRIGTGVDTVGVEPVRINSILGDSMEFAVPPEK
ncbi:ankyrin [Trypanosoma grayi]|uniref:ankyrin n=1 Tax=Trypanosoma grayi TaxID=71804 RepID=UPI0004F44A95|nr:ankyrin [Trypanosoma grayi]KEG11683.1 ankyrin [Trypanosoma grayi]